MIKRNPGELKRLAREILTGNYTISILATLIAAFTPAVMLAPFSAGISPGLNLSTITYGFAAVIILIIGQLPVIGLTRIHLLLAKKQQVTTADIFWTFRSYPDRFILAALLFFGLTLLPAAPAALCIFYIAKIKFAFRYAAITVIFFALCITELYVLYMHALIYPLYIENPEMTVLTVFRTSRSVMHGNKIRLFLLQLSFTGWYLLGICSLGIGLLWIYPYYMQTCANFYLDLTGDFDRGADHIDITVSD